MSNSAFGICIWKNTMEKNRKCHFFLSPIGLKSLKVYICKVLRFAKMQVHSVKGYKKGTGNINHFPNKRRLFETERVCLGNG